MGFPVPLPVGPITSMDGIDLVDKTERDVRPFYGHGIYGQEGSGHQAYRRAQVWALALMRSAMEALQVQSIPDKAIELQPEWEEATGLPLNSRQTVEARQARIRARLLEPKGSDEASIRGALRATVGGPATFNFDYATIVPTLSVRVAIYSYVPPPVDAHIVYPDNKYGRDVIDCLWRVMPAHVQCYVRWMDSPGSPTVKLGA